MRKFIIRFGVLLFMNLVKLEASLQPGPTELFITEEIRVKRQAGYVYNKPSISFDLPTRAPAVISTTTTQAPTVDRTQAQMMYYAYPVPRPPVNDGGRKGAGASGTGGGNAAPGSTGSSGGTSGYNYAQPGSEVTSNAAPNTGSTQGNAGNGQSTGSGTAYSYDRPASGSNGATILSGNSQTSSSTATNSAPQMNAGAGYDYSAPAPVIPEEPKVDVSTNAPQYLPPSNGDGSSTIARPGGSDSSSGGSSVGYSGGSGGSANSFSEGSSGSSEGYSGRTSGGSNAGYSSGPSGGSSGGLGGSAGGSLGYSSGLPQAPSGGYSSGPSGVSGNAAGYTGRSEGSAGDTSSSGSVATAPLSDQYLPPLNQPETQLPPVTTKSADPESSAGRPAVGPTPSVPNSAYIPPSDLPVLPALIPATAPSTNAGQQTGLTSNQDSGYLPPIRPPSPNQTPRPFAPAQLPSNYLPPIDNGTPNQGSIPTPASKYLPPVF